MSWLTNIFQKPQAIKEVFSPHIYQPVSIAKEQALSQAVVIPKTETQFKGEVLLNKIKYPEGLGEEHPFDMVEVEDLTKKFGIVNAIVDKYVDFVIGSGITTACTEEQAKKVIDTFIQDTNMNDALRPWIKDGITKGLGVMELGGKPITGLKVLDSKWCYVDRDIKGNLIKVNQIKLSSRNMILQNKRAGSNTFWIGKEDVIPLEPDEVALLAINRFGDCAYGLGYVYPAMTIINDYLGCRKESLMLLKRKANSPIHVQIGKAGSSLADSIIPSDAVIDEFGAKLEWMNNKHEWVTNPFVNMKVIDFGNLSDKFNFMMENNETLIYESFQVPEVIMGKGSIPEGLAGVQLDVFNRRINAIRSEVEKIIETQIFDPILESRGISVHVEVEWGEESNLQKMERARLLLEILKVPFLNPGLLEQVEKDFGRTLGYSEKEIEDVNAQQPEPQPQPVMPATEPEPEVPAESSRNSVKEYYAEVIKYG